MFEEKISSILAEDTFLARMEEKFLALIRKRNCPSYSREEILQRFGGIFPRQLETMTWMVALSTMMLEAIAVPNSRRHQQVKIAAIHTTTAQTTGAASIIPLIGTTPMNSESTHIDPELPTEARDSTGSAEI